MSFSKSCYVLKFNELNDNKPLCLLCKLCQMALQTTSGVAKLMQDILLLLCIAMLLLPSLAVWMVIVHASAVNINSSLQRFCQSHNIYDQFFMVLSALKRE